MSQSFYTKGIELAQHAVNADEQKEYEVALGLYVRSLEYLLTGLKCKLIWLSLEEMFDIY